MTDIDTSSTHLNEEEPASQTEEELENLEESTNEESTEKELRENLVQNAVQFLSHDTVKTTPLVRRIAFLEKKGLTSEEITEALRRVSSNSPVAPKPNNTLNNRVAPKQTAPLRATRQPINRTPPPPPPPPPPPSTPVWKTIATTILLTLSAVGGLSFLYKHLISRFLQNSQAKLTNESNINEISRTQQERNPRSTAENNHTDKRKPTNTQLEVDVNDLKKTVSELTTTLRELKELRSPAPSPSPYNIANNNQTPPQHLRSSSQNRTPLSSNNSNNYNNGNVNSSNNLNNVTPNKSMYQPFVTKKANFSDILTKVSNGEEIPGIKEIDDAPSNQSLPPPAQSIGAKPWAQRRNEKKDQYSTTTPKASPSAPTYLKSRSELSKSTPNMSPPSPVVDPQLLQTDNIKIEEVADEGESSNGHNEEGVSNLIESLDEITIEEKAE